MLAMHPAAIQSGPQGFFWLFGGGTKANERRGSTAIVHIRDALEHHDDAYSDNYESILSRVSDAMTGADEVAKHKIVQQRHAWANDYKKDYKPLADITPSKPSAVMLCIDSPGGVVSGLNETVASLRRMSSDAGIRLVAYANEMAASAAYALACACSEIVCPASAIIGSIGVISTMMSVSARDKEDGIDVRLITSGDRKADGHPHAPISDAAEGAERERVMKLAKSFWRLASDARGLTQKTLRGYQAGIFLGPDAARKGLVDRVVSFDDAVASVGASVGEETNETARAAKVKKDRLTLLGTPCHGLAPMAQVAQRRR